MYMEWLGKGLFVVRMQSPGGYKPNGRETDSRLLYPPVDLFRIAALFWIPKM